MYDSYDADILNAIIEASMEGRVLRPVVGISEKFSLRLAIIDFKTCEICKKKHNTIRTTAEHDNDIPEHPRCRCEYFSLQTIEAGTATVDGVLGADYVVKDSGQLPSNYVTKAEAKNAGWIQKKGNLHEVLPGIMMYDVYENRSKTLPEGTWIEADINYLGGYRNNQRILFSHDGTIFVTYDHYKTFYELV